ncbi:hypothetical protein ACFRKE_00700 [Kitasatospora indigofera]|uniref:hypothetical protein n=1 Tax=Kitasatospora indigofera TaxID=67307 RepID=UPI00369F1E76
MLNAKTRPSARALSMAGIALCATGLMAGCSSSPGKAPSPAPTPTTAQPTAAPSPTVDPTADAKQQILAAYTGMWAEQVKAYSTGTLVGVDLEKYAGDKALAGIKVTAVWLQDHNQVMKGAPKLSPEVTSIDMASSPRRATLTDCVDSTDLVAVDKTTGVPAKVADDNRRHPQASVARVFNGQWLIMESTIDREKTC